MTLRHFMRHLTIKLAMALSKIALYGSQRLNDVAGYLNAFVRRRLEDCKKGS